VVLPNPAGAATNVNLSVWAFFNRLIKRARGMIWGGGWGTNSLVARMGSCMTHFTLPEIKNKAR
jgi:hypothetical protein